VEVHPAHNGVGPDVQRKLELQRKKKKKRKKKAALNPTTRYCEASNINKTYLVGGEVDPLVNNATLVVAGAIKSLGLATNCQPPNKFSLSDLISKALQQVLTLRTITEDGVGLEDGTLGSLQNGDL
jgi:hypothetical protein